MAKKIFCDICEDEFIPTNPGIFVEAQLCLGGKVTAIVNNRTFNPYRLNLRSDPAEEAWVYDADDFKKKLSLGNVQRVDVCDKCLGEIQQHVTVTIKSVFRR